MGQDKLEMTVLRVLAPSTYREARRVRRSKPRQHTLRSCSIIRSLLPLCIITTMKLSTALRDERDGSNDNREAERQRQRQSTDGSAGQQRGIGERVFQRDWYMLSVAVGVSSQTGAAAACVLRGRTRYISIPPETAGGRHRVRCNKTTRKAMSYRPWR